MAISTYLFINTKPGKINKVLEEVRELPEVKQAHMTTGDYDIIAFTRTNDFRELEKLERTVNEKIREVDVRIKPPMMSIVVA